MKIRNQIEYQVSGRYALFSDPVTRMGGEKNSYLVPTYQALKGITESIYWKPSIIWIVDEVRVMNAIRTESKNIRPISYNMKKNTLSVYNYLSDVSYQVRAHFVFNKNRMDLAEDFNEGKHYDISKRMIKKGGRRDIFLGTRECQGYVEECEFGTGTGYYDKENGKDSTINFGVMFHGFDYPDENGNDILGTRFWNAKMTNGIIKFDSPDEIPAEMRQKVRSSVILKPFSKELGNFSGLDEENIQQELLEIARERELENSVGLDE